MLNPLIKFIFSCLLVAQLFVSCLPSFNRERKPQPVEFIISENSPITKEDYFKLTIDSLNNYLYIKLKTTEALSDFQFPKDKNGNPLTGTAFDFVFSHNGKTIEGACLCNPNSNSTYFGYNKWLSNTISYSSDTLDLKEKQTIEFKIPLYAFHKLKVGQQELELHCSQTVFCSGTKFGFAVIDTAYGDTSTKYIRNYVLASLLSFKAKFKINIPPIFKTKLYGYGIELRNDSVYSPTGMDNTIWNSSYPDVYWTINFPSEDFYCSSNYQKSTAHYELKDTFYLYHYTPNDSIAIGVWDHDNLSRDDYISFASFSVNQFQQNKVARFAFQNIKNFELKAVREGFINK